MSKAMFESEVEDMCLDMFRKLGYDIVYGPDISEGGLSEERKYHEVVLVNRLQLALRRINRSVPDSAIDEAVRKVLRAESQNLVSNNQDFHRLVTNGVNIQYKRADGTIKNELVWLFDFDNPDNNEFLAINQFTIIEEHNNRRPDIILFVNGLPLVLIELKNPADENATVWSAYNQLDTYKHLIPSVCRYNEILIISDGWLAKAGTITSNTERFTPWKTIQNQKAPPKTPEIDILIKGMLNKKTLLDLVRHFIVYEADKDKKDGTVKINKKIAAYQQYNATNKAITSTIEATKKDHKAGIIWHTQGSGKSLTMVFYTGKMVLETELENPTVVVLTDRNDLDDQLFGTFSRCKELLRQEPKQAENREQLQELLKVQSGGIIFTTIQKFFPEIGNQYPQLSDRKNIIVMADEAHRSQYGFGLKIPKNIDKDTLKYGYAKYLRDALPNATFIAFTGTPIEKADRSTPAVFGNPIHTYDVRQSVEDGTTVTILYESRLAKLELKPEERPRIDPEFEMVTEGEEVEGKEYLKSKWSRLEKVVGSPDRIKRVAKDLLEHWESRESVLNGKAMIVCMSRRICIELHNELVKLRPEWYHKDDDKGIIKVIVTGSATDGAAWQEHIRNKERRRNLGERMKDPSDPLKIAIVRDMWLTGFDAPSLNTMYLDKPMKGHTLMQAIARVNRVFKGKEGGLIVDYIGIGEDLKNALSEYTESDQKQTGIPQQVAVDKMLEKYEVVKEFYAGFNFKRFFEVPKEQKMPLMIEAMQHILAQEKGKERYLEQSGLLIKAFALAIPHKDAIAIRDDVGFFQAVRAAIVKTTESKTQKELQDMDLAIKQIISKAVISDRVIDIFAAAGLQKPNISILSDEFLNFVKVMPQKNLAFEALKKLLMDEIKIRRKKNLIQARSFEDLLDKSIKAYTNRSIEAAEIIQQLIELAKKMRDEHKRGAQLNLSEEEVAFYDALADNESAKQVLGDETLKTMAKELVDTVRKNVTVDWTIRDAVQAKLRLLVKKLLKRYGYPPDKQEKATLTVLDQAKLLCKDWAKD
ncbi:MAG: type I restriction endonuclease subunit R [Candidatus Bathyarchaeota archaeon]|nr:type I restriction endonuclease subunit R [Candidatus Bathyarchaeota archaeon]